MFYHKPNWIEESVSDKKRRQAEEVKKETELRKKEKRAEEARRAKEFTQSNRRYFSFQL